MFPSADRASRRTTSDYISHTGQDARPAAEDPMTPCVLVKLPTSQPYSQVHADATPNAMRMPTVFRMATDVAPDPRVEQAHAILDLRPTRADVV